MFFIYDDNCRFCKDWIQVMKHFKYKSDIQFINCEQYNTDYNENLDCKSSSYFIIHEKSGNKIYSGAAGANHLFRRISNNRVLKCLGYLYLIPPINFLMDLGYFIVKKNRNKLRKILK